MEIAMTRQNFTEGEFTHMIKLIRNGVITSDIPKLMQKEGFKKRRKSTYYKKAVTKNIKLNNVHHPVAANELQAIKDYRELGYSIIEIASITEHEGYPKRHPQTIFYILQRYT